MCLGSVHTTSSPLLEWIRLFIRLLSYTGFGFWLFFNSHPISLSANVRVKVVGASAGVGSFVGNQIAGVAEGATAGVAAVRFLAGVCEHVLLVARLLGQALAANVAGEWLDAGVTEQMRAQRRCLAIGFSACLTLVGVVWIV